MCINRGEWADMYRRGACHRRHRRFLQPLAILLLQVGRMATNEKIKAFVNQFEKKIKKINLKIQNVKIYKMLISKTKFFNQPQGKLLVL